MCNVFPACAGMFPHRWSSPSLITRFPRVRGDVPVVWCIGRAKPSFSPRARGCSAVPCPMLQALSVFPACAGMFPIGLRSIQARHRFPRVRGDVPRTAWEAASTAWFSPRARGCSQRLSHLHQGRNVFPACAGMFLSVPDHRFLCYCFPRVRGDVPLWFTAQTGMAAFSPRARGCSRDALIRELAASVFPACAGMFRIGRRG